VLPGGLLKTKMRNSSFTFINYTIKTMPLFDDFDIQYVTFMLSAKMFFTDTAGVRF
jgi:hypothetical protein